MAKVEGDFGHPELVDGSVTTLHSHPSGSGAKEFWVPPLGRRSYRYAYTGTYLVLDRRSGESCAFSFRLPDGFTSLAWAKLIMIPDATETVKGHFLISAHAVGEDKNYNRQNNWGETLAVTKNDLTEWDIATFFPPLSAGDYVGVRLISKTTKLRVVGLAVRYI